jgi:hypothetical protein
MGIQVAEDRPPFAGDAHFDDPPVPLAANAIDQFTGAQTVDQPRDVRVAGNHPVGNLAA